MTQRHTIEIQQYYQHFVMDSLAVECLYHKNVMQVFKHILRASIAYKIIISYHYHVIRVIMHAYIRACVRGLQPILLENFEIDVACNS